VLLKYSVNLLNAIFTTNKQLIYLNDNKVQFFFTGCDGYSPVSFQWNFGDGSSNSTARNPIHQYSEIGDYTVILTLVALNGDMDVFIRENYISVEGIDPSVVVISIVISICVVVGLITLGVVVYRRKRKKTSKVVSIDTDTQLLSSKIEKISNLFKLSQSVKIDDAAELIGISRKELLNILVENRDSLKGITINNDILTLSSVEDVSDFIELLDKQFDSWKDKEKSKLGKI
jgi:PKD repeat protein